MNAPAPPRTLSPEALDFAPGLLSIQESPPARLPRAVLYAVCLLFATLLLWALFGQLDIIASAEGRLVPQTYVKIVQPADAGIVEEILVREGQAVRAGQVLIRMDTRIAQADRNTLETELALRSLQLRRIEAELTATPLERLPTDTDDLFRKVEAQHRDRRQAFEDAEGQAREGLRKTRRDYESGKEILAKLREITPLLKAQSDAFTDMGQEGYVAQVTVREKQREYLEKARDLRAQEEAVASLAAAMAQAGKQLSQIASQYRSELQNERVEAEGQYRRLQQEQIKLEHKSGLLELKASQAGIIKDLATHTIGAVVSPGTVVLTLVPENEPLVAEVMIRNDDVGFVYPRQEVKVKLAAYPFQKYGLLDGEVIHVGPDASESGSPTSQEPQETLERPPPQLAYKALIALKSQVLEARGKTLKLVPGMQVIAEIHQGQRTVMEYLLSPVQKTLYDSGRER
ncbi:MAG: HlyD family type I secretion periplasmic adaptor subunit [Candidatus Accumulibacter sp.]|jgi:HlyD family secretion protein|nr:HlyD family type I secretion periplasmic adaptor subunit [Accumulibacter sp.]